MPRTDLTRLPDKGSDDRARLDTLLDSAVVGHVGLVVDEHPVVVPTAIARDEDTLLVHGSTGSGWMRGLAAGAAACVEVTAYDGIVVARTAFESSLHYRSAVVFGTFTLVGGDAKTRALDLITDTLIPGRATEVRRPTERELAATMVLAMPIERWSLKISDGWPEDEEDDVVGPAWAGVVPLGHTWGEPRPAPDLRPGIGVPASVRDLGSGPAS